MEKPLWSLHKLWGLGVWQRGGEEGFTATAALPHNLSPKYLTILLRQFKQNTDMMGLCNGDVKEHYSFLFWFPVLVHLCGLIPTAAAAHHLPLFKAKFLSTRDKVSLVAGPPCVMLYWEVTTRQIKPNLPFKSMVLDAITWNKEKKSTGKQLQQYSMCQCSGWWKAGSSDDNPMRQYCIWHSDSGVICISGIP